MSAQSLIALAGANEVRSAHAGYRKELRALDYYESRARAAEILRDPDEPASKMRLRYLLASVTYMGPTKMTKVMRQSNLVAGRLERRIGELTERERLVLAWTLTQ